METDILTPDHMSIEDVEGEDLGDRRHMEPTEEDLEWISMHLEFQNKMRTFEKD
jgi:hypothetical protein